MSSSDTLKNKRIVVTRPRNQANKLVSLITEHGGEAILFPTIEIKKNVNTKKTESIFNSIDEYDTIIFVSRNAVIYTFDSLLTPASINNKTNIISIGQGTTEELNRFNIEGVIESGLNSNSEALLDLPELDEENIRSRRILLIRGEGGRSLLFNELIKRGSIVDSAEVYQRLCPEYDEAVQDSLWIPGPPDAIIVTSNEGLENLIKLVSEKHQASLINTPLVTISNRTSELARAIKFVSKLEVAHEKTDQGLLSALFDLLEIKNK